MSRSSQEQAAEHRRVIVAAASRLMRQKGVDGVGIRELMASAGLTQGAFAGQFGSKDALAAEACTAAFDAAAGALAGAAGDGAPGRAHRIAEDYLRPKPLDQSCPMVTLSADAARSAPGSAMHAAFTDGFGRLARIVAGEPPGADRLVLLAAMVGAAVLRGASGDGALAEEIDAAVLGFSRGIA